VVGHNLVDWLQLGLSPMIGTQIQITERLRYGMTIRVPSVRMLTLLGSSEVITTSAVGATNNSVTLEDKVAVEARVLSPARMTAGLSYKLERTQFALDG